jgi:hypothetical protein
LKEEIEHQLTCLIGLPLVMAGRAADMRLFHFGAVRPTERRSVGEYALHIQCAWRLDSPRGIITGRSDLYRVPNGEWVSEDWDYSGDTLQDTRLRELLGHQDPITGVLLESEKQLIVERVEGSSFGDTVIYLSKGYRLVIFPSGTRGEAWRLFRPGSEEEHFVVDEESA